MPIYEYQCSGCGAVTEVMQKMTDPPPAVCPECGHTKLSKLVSASAFVLKGGGWYSDAYSSKKNTAKETSEKGSDSAAEAKPASSAPSTEKKSEPAPPTSNKPSSGKSDT